MTITSPQIILKMGDAEVSAIESPSEHDRVDIDDIVTGEALRSLKYATFEPDKWLLDGSFHFAPDPAHVGFVSANISNANREFTGNPEFYVTLDAVVDIEQGVTLEFSEVSGDYCESVLIEYRDVSYILIDSDTYSPDSFNFFCEAPTPPIADVKFVYFRFLKTNIAERHVKLLGVYVDGVLFDKNNIRSANLLEQIDPSSIHMPSNELNFSVYNDDGDFSIVNPQGFYANLAKNQKVDVYEYVDDARHYLGRFYLEKWNSKNANLASFSCNDAVYLTTKIVNRISGTYYYVASGGSGYAIAAQKIVDYLTFVFLYLPFDYDTDAGLLNTIMTGFVDIEISVRDTLQLIAYGAESYITCSRSNTINLKESVLAVDLASWDFIFETSDIGANPKITLKSLVTGINLTAHSYPIDSKHNDFQVYDGDVVNGVQFIKLPSDYFSNGSWVKTGSSTTAISADGARFLELTTTNPGTLNIYLDDSRMHVIETFSIRTGGLPDGTPENVLPIEDATLVTPHNADDVLTFCNDYHKQRYVCEFRLFASLVEVGNVVKVAAQGEILSGIVEKIESDLVNGFTQTVTVVGNIL